MSGEKWTQDEVEAIVADYFEMLSAELSGTHYSKTSHRRALKLRLTHRSDGSIEYKHCNNISAALCDLGFPSIEGYKPRFNYQRLVAEVVATRLQQTGHLRRLAIVHAKKPALEVNVANVLDALRLPPERQKSNAPAPGTLVIDEIGTVDHESSNESLAVRGIEFVLNFERARLERHGRQRLAQQVRLSNRDPHPGFDILSFNPDGSNRFISVKTTNSGPYSPFIVTQTEVLRANLEGDRYYLYRAYSFRQDPKLYCLRAPLEAVSA